MYTPETITALSADRFDFTRFDWRRAKAAIVEHLTDCRNLRRNGMADCVNGEAMRPLHVTYALARGREIVGPRGIEQANTRKPMSPNDVDYILSSYELPEEVEEVEDVAA